MTRYSLLSCVGLVGLLAVAPVHAQENDQDGSGLVLSVGGGGFSPLTELDDPGDADFKTGFRVGGGLAYQFNRYVALRGNFNFARSEGRDTRTGISPIRGVKFDRFLYDADLQLRYPFASGVTPYVFVGGGAMTVNPPDSAPDQESFTKGAGKVGAGFSYQIPRSNVGLYLEGAGWIYNWDRYGFDKRQFDTTWGGGISYRFGL